MICRAVSESGLARSCLRRRFLKRKLNITCWLATNQIRSDRRQSQQKVAKEAKKRQQRSARYVTVPQLLVICCPLCCLCYFLFMSLAGRTLNGVSPLVKASPPAAGDFSFPRGLDLVEAILLVGL